MTQFIRKHPIVQLWQIYRYVRYDRRV